MKFFLLLFIAVGCSGIKKNNIDSASVGLITESSIKTLIKDWPLSSQEAVKEMMLKYKLPQEATATQLTWYQTGPFKRSIVHKEEVHHQFPIKHADVLEQVVDYRVPFNRVDDLWNFNGSIVLSKTAGEISSWAESEEMNLLLLNLAYEIMTDKKSTHEARKELSKVISSSMKGEQDSKMQELKFSPSERSADPDLIMIKEEIPRNAMTK